MKYIWKTRLTSRLVKWVLTMMVANLLVAIARKVIMVILAQILLHQKWRLMTTNFWWIEDGVAVVHYSISGTIWQVVASHTLLDYLLKSLRLALAKSKSWKDSISFWLAKLGLMGSQQKFKSPRSSHLSRWKSQMT